MNHFVEYLVVIMDKSGIARNTQIRVWDRRSYDVAAHAIRKARLFGNLSPRKFYLFPTKIRTALVEALDITEDKYESLTLTGVRQMFGLRSFVQMMNLMQFGQALSVSRKIMGEEMGDEWTILGDPSRGTVVSVKPSSFLQGLLEVPVATSPGSTSRITFPFPPERLEKKELIAMLEKGELHV